MLGRTLAAWSALLIVLVVIQSQVNADGCSEPEEPGPCKGKISRYFFDVNVRRCRRFSYGGCKGNGNNFSKLSKCKNACERGKSKRDRKGRKSKECQSGFKRLGRRCIKEEAASCREGYKRVKDRCVRIRVLECHEGFRRIGNKCLEEETGAKWKGGKRGGGRRGGGRRGGGKRKVDKCLLGKWCSKPKRVTRRCPKGYHRDGNKCVEDEAVFCPRGYQRKRGRCIQIEPRECPFGFLPVGRRCIKISRPRCADGYTRADGKCFLSEAEDRCELPKRKGPCKANLPRYYFDSDSGTCEKFHYGGCDGNNNRFLSKARCMEVCQDRRRCPKNYKRVGKRCVEVKLVEAETRDRCELPKHKGPCHKNLLRFYYDSDEEICRQFYYGGCGGNKNRFITKSHCQEVCGGGKDYDEDDDDYHHDDDDDDDDDAEEETESSCDLDFEGNCVSECPKGYTADDGVCVRIKKCREGLLRLRDTCAHKCPPQFCRFKSSCVRKCPKGYKKRGKVCRRKGSKPSKPRKCSKGYWRRGRCWRKSWKKRRCPKGKACRRKGPKPRKPTRCPYYTFRGKCVKKCPSYCIARGRSCVVRRRG